MSATGTAHERREDRDENDGVSPACTIAKQCRDRDFEEKPRRVLGVFYEPCNNPSCFAAEDADEVPADAVVVIARGRSTGKFHRLELDP